MKDKKVILNSEPSVLTEALHYKTTYHCRVKERERARRQEGGSTERKAKVSCGRGRRRDYCLLLRDKTHTSEG